METLEAVLAADPYYFNNSKFFEKADFIRRDAGRLMEFFDKSQEEVYETSKSYIGREENLYLFITSIKFWQNAVNVQLTDESTNLSSLVTIFCAESMLGNQIAGNSDRFRNFLLNYLNRDEKIELLSGYTFGMPRGFGQGRLRKKHLCHGAVVLTESGSRYNREYCSSGEHPLCECRNWLINTSDEKVNRYTNMLGTFFYNMRNAVVHDAGYVRFTSMPYIDDEIGEIIPTTADAFSNHEQKTYTSYDTDITVQRFHEIMRKAAWRCFKVGSKIKEYKKVQLLKRL